jgi:hypothetical protein
MWAWDRPLELFGSSRESLNGQRDPDVLLDDICERGWDGGGGEIRKMLIAQ